MGEMKSMKVLLVDLDNKLNRRTRKKKIPNFALMKISKYYKNLGAEVGWNVADPDIVYISSIFTKNRTQGYGIASMYPNADIRFGGTGFNYSILPSEIENTPPDYSLYPSTYSQGYTTRGCKKNCPWCIVREKEGKFRRTKHIKLYHNPEFKKIMVMDNCWLGDKKWFMKNTDYILEENLVVLEHGMNIEFVDEEIAERLLELRFEPDTAIKFAYDQPRDREKVKEGIKILKEAGHNIKRNVMFYVLTGFNTTHEEDLQRCNELKEWGTSSFVMQYKPGPFTKKLARWSNRKSIFWSTSFEEYSTAKSK